MQQNSSNVRHSTREPQKILPYDYEVVYHPPYCISPGVIIFQRAKMLSPGVVYYVVYNRYVVYHSRYCAPPGVILLIEGKNIYISPGVVYWVKKGRLLELRLRSIPLACSIPLIRSIPLVFSIPLVRGIPLVRSIQPGTIFFQDGKNVITGGGILRHLPYVRPYHR